MMAYKSLGKTAHSSMAWPMPEKYMGDMARLVRAAMMIAYTQVQNMVVSLIGM